jgi:hypothetical protein
VVVVVVVVVMVVLFFFKEMKRSRARALRFVFVWAKFLLSLSYYVDMGEDRNVKRIVNVPKEFSSLSRCVLTFFAIKFPPLLASSESHTPGADRRDWTKNFLSLLFIFSAKK